MTSETQRTCHGKTIAAILVLGVTLAITGCTTYSGPSDVSSGPTRHTEAKLDVTCSNGTKFSLSTGTKAGICRTNADGGSCQDGNNTASVSCKTGCTESSGSGSCTNK